MIKNSVILFVACFVVVVVVSETSGTCGNSLTWNYNENTFLFDTGYSNLYKTNAELLNIDLSKITTVILSHGHSDHTNGVPFLDPGKTIIMHPAGFKERYSIRKKEYAGFPITEEEVREKHNLILSKDSIEVFPNVYFLGEIPMTVDFEAQGNFSTTLDDKYTQTDYTEDDSGIIIKTEKGLMIFTGCGHRGVCNTIEKAMSITGEKRIYAMFGGFHLRDLEKRKEQIDLTIQYFKQLGVENLYLGHCITDPVIDYFEKNMENAHIYRLHSGAVYSVV